MFIGESKLNNLIATILKRSFLDMKKNNDLGNYVFIDLDEHLARVCDLMPGWCMVDCTGDVLYQQLYLEQNLTTDDMQEWVGGMVTEHCQELLNDVDVEVADVRIRYSQEHRRYEVYVPERIAIELSELRFATRELDFLCQ
jgi:hypothetical protein